MNFWEILGRVFPRRPGAAFAALYWHLTRRRVRARNLLRVASADLPFAYDLWIATHEASADLAGSESDVGKAQSWQPSFAIMPYADGAFSEEDMDRSLRSVERQAYRCWSLLERHYAPFTQRLDGVDADFVIPLRIGDELSQTALLRFAEALRKEGDASLLYGDQDVLTERGRRTKPWFKPQWNEEMFFAQDYISAAVAIETDLAKSAACNAGSISELLIVATGRAKERVIHTPHIVIHTSAHIRLDPDRLGIIAKHLASRGATCSRGPFGTVKVDWPLPGRPPMVSIIVPTKDGLDLLKPCIDSILRTTSYQNFEVLIIDNGSIRKRTADYLAQAGTHAKVRVLEFPGPYNFSKINNFAVQDARGEYLCLLNNDTEVVEPLWLTEMMRQAVRPIAGAVGAKLLYGDRSIQHAGVVIGMGEAAGHAHRFLRAGEAGYFGQPHISQFVSAVTAACLVVQKAKFLAVGGLDEDAFPVAFNDVDLCLRLERAGWRNIYVPHAVLLHHESRSRGADSSPLNRERYRRELSALQERWATKTYQDPLHNPNLDRNTETFALRL